MMTPKWQQSEEAETAGSVLSLLIIFIVYQYVCRSFLTAEPKKNIRKSLTFISSVLSGH